MTHARDDGEFVNHRGAATTESDISSPRPGLQKMLYVILSTSVGISRAPVLAFDVRFVSIGYVLVDERSLSSLCVSRAWVFRCVCLGIFGFICAGKKLQMSNS